MRTHQEKLQQLLSLGPQTPRDLQTQMGISQPTLSRLLNQMKQEVVQLGKGRATQYTRRDRQRGLGDVTVYRITSTGHISRLGVLVPVRPEGFVMQNEDGTSLHSHGLPWWLLDMRPQGFLGRAYAHKHAVTLGLPTNVQHWSDTDALRALLVHGHDAVGNLVLGDAGRAAFLSQSPPPVVGLADKGPCYALLAQQAQSGDFPASSAAGEQPKFVAYAHTPKGVRHVLVKFSLKEHHPVTQRWRDLLLAEHHALETLRATGIPAVTSWVHDHGGQRFLEVERFDRTDAMGRRGLFSLAALEAEFIGKPREPWPVLVQQLVRDKIVLPDADATTQALFAFGRLTGNTDMHTGNLSFTSESGRPYRLAPAYDMLPMAFQPTSGGGLGHALPPLDLHPCVSDPVWQRMLPVANAYVQRLRSDTRFSDDFSPCIQALQTLLKEAGQRIALMG